MRNHKSEDELEEIERAIDISAEMHLTAYRMARPGVEESEIAAAVAAVATRHGETLAFPTIATTQGQVLHNHGFIHTLHAGELFLLDAGAETKLHYAGDLSSTMPVSDQFSSRQAEIYEIHLSSFWAAVDCLNPGTPFRTAHIAAATKIAEGMKSLGLMKGDPAEAAEMIMIYSSVAFDEFSDLSAREIEIKGKAFICHIERILSAKENSLVEPIMIIFKKQMEQKN